MVLKLTGQGLIFGPWIIPTSDFDNMQFGVAFLNTLSGMNIGDERSIFSPYSSPDQPFLGLRVQQDGKEVELYPDVVLNKLAEYGWNVTVTLALLHDEKLWSFERIAEKRPDLFGCIMGRDSDYIPVITRCPESYLETLKLSYVAKRERVSRMKLIRPRGSGRLQQ